LIADEDLHTVAFVRFTGWLDIDSIDVGASLEIVAPQCETSATIDADLHDMDIAVAKLHEVSMVDIEIMVPLPDSGAFIMRKNIVSQRILVWRFASCSFP
jgi:hypothetical protein